MTTEEREICYHSFISGDGYEETDTIIEHCYQCYLCGLHRHETEDKKTGEIIGEIDYDFEGNEIE